MSSTDISEEAELKLTSKLNQTIKNYWVALGNILFFVSATKLLWWVIGCLPPFCLSTQLFVLSVHRIKWRWEIDGLYSYFLWGVLTPNMISNYGTSLWRNVFVGPSVWRGMLTKWKIIICCENFLKISAATLNISRTESDL